MKKTLNKRNSLSFVVGGAVLGATLSRQMNLASQRRLMQMLPGLSFDQQQHNAAVMIGGLIGAFLGWLASKYANNCNAVLTYKEMNDSIVSSLQRHKLDKSDLSYQKLDGHAKLLEQVISNQYWSKLSGELYRQGSTQKGTALASAYDIDIVVTFRQGSFKSLRQMYDDVFSFLEHISESLPIMMVRQQKKSIGLLYNVSGKDYWIDVIPYKISNPSKSKTTGSLCVNEIRGLFGYSGHTKTDPKKLGRQQLGKTQRNVLILLKRWKQEYALPIKSILLEHLIKNAYRNKKGNIPKNDLGRLRMVLRYIADNLDHLHIRSVENRSNVLTNLTVRERRQITSACEDVLYDFQNYTDSFCQAFS